MSGLVLVDTDVLIDASREVGDAIGYLEHLEGHSMVAVSAVTQMELIVGCANRSELHTVDRFLSRFEVVSLNEQISERAVELLREYRLSYGLLIADALIAATAITMDIPFVTKNQRHFRSIAGLNLLAYPQVNQDLK